MTKEMTYKKKVQSEDWKEKNEQDKIQMTKPTQCFPPDFSISF